MKLGFIHAEKASSPVAALCRLLGVTRQGYYAFVKRQRSPRMLAALRQQGVRVGERGSARLSAAHRVA